MRESSLLTQSTDQFLKEEDESGLATQDQTPETLSVSVTQQTKPTQASGMKLLKQAT